MRQNQFCSGWRMCPPSCPAEAERGLFGGLVPSLGCIRATLGAAFPIQVASYTALTELSCRWVAAKLSRIPAMVEHIPCESRIRQLFEGMDSSFCSGKTFLCLTSWPPQLSVSEALVLGVLPRHLALHACLAQGRVLVVSGSVSRQHCNRFGRVCLIRS